MRVENLSDELWVGAKDLSNWEIARTPRNVFKNSPVNYVIEVELPIGLGDFIVYQTQMNSECYDIQPGVRLRALRSGAKREITQTIS